MLIAQGYPTVAAMAVVVAMSVPGAPTIVSTLVGNNSVTINWTVGSGATSYNVKRSLTSDGTFANLSAATGITGTSFIDTTAVNGTQYFYKVSGVNSVGEGPVSNVSIGTTPAVAVGPPSGLTATYVAGAGIRLNWTNGTGGGYLGVNVYKLSGATMNGVPQRVDPTPYNYLPGNINTFMDYLVGTGLANKPNSNSHSYFVTGILSTGETAPSNTSGFVTFVG